MRISDGSSDVCSSDLLGNAGSPLETEAGWLVITHGVGPFREYALGAILLDLDDPARVIGRLKEPLLLPAADERDGYVPNRSEERRGGKECVSTCRSRGSPYHQSKKKTKPTNNN